MLSQDKDNLLSTPSATFPQPQAHIVKRKASQITTVDLEHAPKNPQTEDSLVAETRADFHEDIEQMAGAEEREKGAVEAGAKRKYRRTDATNPNGRAKGRNLVGWAPPFDQLAMLFAYHEMHAGGYEGGTLWENVIWRLTKDPNKTGHTIPQHLKLLRNQLFDFGYMVPPWNCRENCPTVSRRYRGVVKTHVCDEHPQGWRFVTWEEHLHPTQSWIDVKLPGEASVTRIHRPARDWPVNEDPSGVKCPFNTRSEYPGKTNREAGRIKHADTVQDAGFGGEARIRVSQAFGAGADDDEDDVSDHIDSERFTEEQRGGAEDPAAGPKEKGSNGFLNGPVVRRRRLGKSSETMIQQLGRPVHAVNLRRKTQGVPSLYPGRQQGVGDGVSSFHPNDQQAVSECRGM